MKGAGALSRRHLEARITCEELRPKCFLSETLYPSDLCGCFQWLDRVNGVFSLSNLVIWVHGAASSAGRQRIRPSFIAAGD